MWRKYIINWRSCLIICVMAIIGLQQNIYAVDKIYPSGPPEYYLQDETKSITYYRDVPNGGYAAITPNNPRGWYDSSCAGGYCQGNASLELKTTGDVTDWVFYNRYADDDVNGGTSWGFLSDVNGLSFDWYRNDIQENWNTEPTDWQEKSQVLRIYIGDYNDDGVFFRSELVWENWYDTAEYQNISNTNQNNENYWAVWNEENILNENLWRHIFAGETTNYLDLYTDRNGVDVDYFGGSGYHLTAISISEWALQFYSDEAYIYGIGVGVGSGWPHVFTGYVDNIYLSFDDGNGGTDVAVYDNFELPVPESSSVILLMLGLALLLGSQYRFCREGIRIFE
ncbi:MAG: hypothetical protein JXA41_12570 [Deltaproteobacteria bacterium]|nr:hypothetical protein [Deltaproteobacteria bacterium]